MPDSQRHHHEVVQQVAENETEGNPQQDAADARMSLHQRQQHEQRHTPEHVVDLLP